MTDAKEPKDGEIFSPLGETYHPNPFSGQQVSLHRPGWIAPMPQKPDGEPPERGTRVSRKEHYKGDESTDIIMEMALTKQTEYNREHDRKLKIENYVPPGHFLSANGALIFPDDVVERMEYQATLSERFYQWERITQTHPFLTKLLYLSASTMKYVKGFRLVKLALKLLSPVRKVLSFRWLGTILRSVKKSVKNLFQRKSRR